MSEWDAIIVGGGAAGLWAAGTAAARGRRVLVLEKNKKAGVKILMSGGTRCNITHNCESRQIADAFGREGRVLLSALSRLSPKDVIQTIEAEGVATKTEETGKIFPVSNHAIDVRDALVRRLASAGAELRTGTAALDVRRSHCLTGFEVATESGTLACESVLVTTGGLSYSGCGTTGDGYAWLQSLGHTITRLRPALTPILSPAQWVHMLQGITLDDVAVTICETENIPSGKAADRHTYRGGLLWTHFGCSGPTAMNVSRWISDLTNYRPASLRVDLVPDWSEKACQNWLANGSNTNGARAISTLLSERLPKRLASVLLEESKIDPAVRVAELSLKARIAIVERMKGWRIPISGTRGYAMAEVTAGGVSLKEVDFQTMQSRFVPGLFLAGEILDLDGPIGGYNFQAAWSTGHTAGLFV